MPEKKRNSNLAVSPAKDTQEKRKRNEKENIADSGQSHIRNRNGRSIYRFPTNNLSSSTPLKSINLDPNVPKGAINKTPSKASPRTIVRSDSFSSDDHVFWAPTPRAQAKLEMKEEEKKLSSSPITEELSIPINPINNFQQRYNSIKFDHFSSQISPELHRTKSFPYKSDVALSANELKKSNLNDFGTPQSNVLNSSNKKDITSLITAVESGFSSDNTPFNMFIKSHKATDSTKAEGFTPSKLQSVSTKSLDIEFKIPFEKSSDALNNVEGNSNLRDMDIDTLEEALEDEEEDEDFSEDFLNDLDQVLSRKSQSLKPAEKVVLQETAMTKPDDVLNPVLLQDDQNERLEHDKDKSSVFSEDDSFSDFDEMIDKILEKGPTQVATTNTQISLTTQEKNIKTVDRQGHLIFKRDIDETDSKFSRNSFKRPNENMARCAVERDGVHRFQVSRVTESFYARKGIKTPQKILTVIDSKGQNHNVVVRDGSSQLEFEKDDVIHIIGENIRLVDNESDNLLIWNPDQLLSATLIGDTLNCKRRAVLKTRLDFRGDYNKPLIVGEIVHSVFQSVLREHNSSMNAMKQYLEEELDAELIKILTINESKETIRQEVADHLPYIKTWFDLYVKELPNISSSVKISAKAEQSLFATSNVLDIEENIWSPIYGLRGLIDVTIEANLREKYTNGKFIAPLELKSGKSEQIAHKAQASLYTLLMKDRYDMDVNFFMLVYTKLQKTMKHEIKKRDLKDLINIRNSISSYFKEGVRALPGLLKQSACDNCYAVQECMTLNKLTEDGTEEEAGLKEGVFTTLTEHLDKQEYKSFYDYWDDLITKEEGTINLLKKDLFLIGSEERERTSGKCLANLVIKSSKNDDIEDSSSFIYTFERGSSGHPSLVLSQLGRHDRILVSDEKGHFALCSGWVTNLRHNEIVITTNRRLNNSNLKMKDFNSQNNQTYQTVLKPKNSEESIEAKTTYRIDKDEMFHGMKLARSNLLNLFSAQGDHKRRKLIVDDVSPTFSNKPLPFNLDSDHTFNTDQIKAFNKVLSANDYALLLGMPGTGKTTVIAQLIKFLIANGKTVLLTSYTHSAVDNILMKLKDDSIDILRLGSVNRIHPEVQHYSPYKKKIVTHTDLTDCYMKPPVVATTCLGISDWLFNHRKFDYCIVDESSQVSMPVCIGPLASCDKFVLVGDHYQLPPLVQNPEAKAGLSKSLFKMLSETHPEAVVELTHQYRMCADIMLLSNTLIYEGKLKCGSDAVANQALSIPNIEKLNSIVIEEDKSAKPWLDSILDPNNRVLFLNHDSVGGCNETSIKENIENKKEAELIRQIVEAMTFCGVSEESIGVMSFYRAQLRLFYRLFSEKKGIEMLTADQFQGRDKECVIISLVKSNDNGDVGSLIKEWRRLNVAITRAKSKLIIVGSKKTLRNLKTIDIFMKILDSRGWFYDLPPNADTYYDLKQYSTQGLTTSPVKRATVKKLTESKILKDKLITQNIAEEMGI